MRTQKIRGGGRGVLSTLKIRGGGMNKVKNDGGVGRMSMQKIWGI